MTSCYSVQQDKNASCLSKVWAVDCENTLNGLAQGTEEHQQVLQRLTDRLTKQEQVRVSRYRQTADSLRFATGRAAIRSLIKDSNVSSEHCRNTLKLPEPLINSPNDGSKPSLDESSRLIYKNIADFNISHDGDWVLAGIANRGIIGIDVARVYCPVELSVDQYINEFSFQLSANEKSFLAHDSKQKIIDFYCIWTVKEAYVKAVGTGIAAQIDLSTINVLLSPKGVFEKATINGNLIPLTITTGSLKNNAYVYAIASSPQQAISVDIVQIQAIY